MCPQKSGIPDRWADYCNFKSVIKECRLLPCKTPLKDQIFRNGVENGLLREDQNFTPSDLCGMVRERLKLQIEFVIDFTNTRRYYFNQDFEDGVRYIKIPCIGQCVPPPDVYNQFHMAMDTCSEVLSDDGVIAVHCTHGLNRSGFLVCNYLMNKFGYTMEQAVCTFDTARGHRIERVEYLDKLRNDKYPAPTQNTFKLEDHPVAETITTDSIANDPLKSKSPPLVKRKGPRQRKRPSRHMKKPSTPKEEELYIPPHKRHQRHPYHNTNEYESYPPHPLDHYPPHPLDHYPRHHDYHREPPYHAHNYYEHTSSYSNRPREFEPYYSRQEHEQASYYIPPEYRPPRDRYHHPPPVYLPPQAWGPPEPIPKGAYRIHDSRPRNQSSHKHHSEVRTYSGVPYIKH